MSAAVEKIRILTATNLSEGIISPVGDKCKFVIGLVVISGGIS
jgi:hypothetical protein